MTEGRESHGQGYKGRGVVTETQERGGTDNEAETTVLKKEALGEALLCKRKDLGKKCPVWRYMQGSWEEGVSLQFAGRPA